MSADLKKKSSKVFEKAICRTFQEMILDVKKIDPNTANEMQVLFDAEKSSKAIMRQLQDENSPLCKSIPKKLLEKDINGINFLNTLCLIQPALKPTPSKKKNKKTTDRTSDVALKKEMEKLEPVTDKLKALFADQKHGELEKLLGNMVTDMKIEDRLNDEMGMANMLGMMTEISGYMQTKIEKGELDKEKLTSEALSLCSKLQNTDEFKEILENPELQASLQGDGSEMQAEMMAKMIPALGSMTGSKDAGSFTGIAKLAGSLGSGGGGLGGLAGALGNMDLIGGLADMFSPNEPLELD